MGVGVRGLRAQSVGFVGVAVGVGGRGPFLPLTCVSRLEHTSGLLLAALQLARVFKAIPHFLHAGM